MISTVSVVIPANDEEKRLPGCLAAVRRAARALDGTPVHVIVVADACGDRTAELAREAGAAVVEISARNVGAARAAGMRAALRQAGHLDPAAVWLATTDADTHVPPHWLGAQLRYAAAGWDAVVGTVRVADWSGWPSWLPSRFARRYDDGTGSSHSHVHGANLGFRADAYLAAGGFGPRPTGEDHALIASLTATGSRVLRTREVTVVTSARRRGRAPGGFSRLITTMAGTRLR